MKGQDKKEINFELNLLPVISLLAVCISFLLLTAVWIHIGTLDIDQALGSEGKSKEAPPSLWLEVTGKGQVTARLRDVEKPPEELKAVRINSQGRSINWPQLEGYMASVIEELPDLNTVVISPDASTPYNLLIQLMDKVRDQGIRDVGILPL